MYKQNFIFITFTILLLAGCGASDVGKVMRNEKVSSNDEFLVKKREPLILPPDYDTLPEPMSEESINKENDNNINKILKIPNEQENSKKKSSSVEQSIINEIRK